MKNAVAKLSNSIADIEEFVNALRGVRANRISAQSFAALKRGEYLFGPMQAEGWRGPGGRGLCSDRFSREQWEEAWLALDAQEKERSLADTLDSIERERRDAHIRALIGESFSAASETQKQTLAREIDRYAATDRLGELQEFLEDVRSKGLAEAQSRREHGGRKTLWAYFIPGIGVALEIAIAVRILSVVESGFQTIVVSLLLIMYAAIVHKIQALQYGVWFFGLDMQRSFLAAFRWRNHPGTESASDERSRPEAIRNLRRSAVNTLVSSCRSSALIVIALWELVKTIK